MKDWKMMLRLAKSPCNMVVLDGDGIVRTRTQNEMPWDWVRDNLGNVVVQNWRAYLQHYRDLFKTGEGAPLAGPNYDADKCNDPSFTIAEQVSMSIQQERGILEQVKVCCLYVGPQQYAASRDKQAPMISAISILAMGIPDGVLVSKRLLCKDHLSTWRGGEVYHWLKLKAETTDCKDEYSDALLTWVEINSPEKFTSGNGSFAGWRLESPPREPPDVVLGIQDQALFHRTQLEKKTRLPCFFSGFTVESELGSRWMIAYEGT
eukprot:gnl/TRDRNA2_/TRDRNA2_177421_c0_seq1.p1 gnl/TRDRNA2_/TRDRNA2_177421_c0~~gnl/TRDRNA2_/TRDRNA2_177421_c0_seq1.p1  ORF type:complete len:263 (+),score=24.44 gnl/TRDRNA2_/TRDRNA2_177421_c0_seq1:149-937(+)